MTNPKRGLIWSFPALFLAVRLMLVITLPLEGLRGFGDLAYFYQQAGLGRPFLDYWVEFPPIFPWLSRLLFLVSGGREHIYDYLLILILSCVQAGSLTLFILLAEKVGKPREVERRAMIYLVLLVGLPYNWWYFDSLVVFFMLLGVYWMLNRQDLRAGITLAIGTILKFFPALILPALWRYRPLRKAFIVSLLTVGITSLVYGGFYLASPDNTAASIHSQLGKSSWETVWALVDGNFNTGNFGPLSQRYNPLMAYIELGNQARIPTYITLLPMLAVGGWLFWRARISTPLSPIAFSGLTWCIFLLWSPGWSPQWVLYLIPLILLTLPLREGTLMVMLLVFINLLEWPVLLSRGYSWGLWLTIPIRTALMMLLGYFWYRQIAPVKDSAANLPAGLQRSPDDSLPYQEY